MTAWPPRRAVRPPPRARPRPAPDDRGPGREVREVHAGETV